MFGVGRWGTHIIAQHLMKLRPFVACEGKHSSCRGPKLRVCGEALKHVHVATALYGNMHTDTHCTRPQYCGVTETGTHGRRC